MSKKVKGQGVVKPNVAFGSAVKRFGRITIHPKLDPSGLYANRPEGCDPGLYSPQDINIIYKVNKNLQTKDPWMYKNELEDWSKNLGYRNQKILAIRRWYATTLGPAWHEVKEPQCMLPVTPDIGFGRTHRVSQIKNNNPGPGTYYKCPPFKAPYGPHSTVPTFEYAEACRFLDTTKNWSLAPNRYRIIDKDSIEEKPNRVVSIRGPYDLFTGPRDETTIKSHFSKVRNNNQSWPQPAKGGSFEQLKLSHFGRMNRTGRDKPYRGRQALVDLAMCPRRPKDPGPTAYNVDKPRVFIENINAFNSSNTKPVGYKRAVVWPGVGRYSVKYPTCGILGQGHKHVFLSKIERTIGGYIQQPMNSF